MERVLNRSPEHRYFPSNEHGGHCGVDEDCESTFGTALSRMEEPVLFPPSQGAPDSEVYRFVCLPAFDAPYCMRVQRLGEKVTAAFKATDGEGGWDPGALLRELGAELPVEQWHRFSARLEKYYFWSTPVNLLRQNQLDGEAWLMEGVRGDHYRAILRSGGTVEAIFRELLAAAPSYDPQYRSGAAG